MSIQAMLVVIKYSPQVWGEQLLLLRIAERANWPDFNAEISEATLAGMVGRTPRHLIEHIRRLEACGELHCFRKRGRPTIYHVPPYPDEPERRPDVKYLRDHRRRAFDQRLADRRAERPLTFLAQPAECEQQQEANQP